MTIDLGGANQTNSLRGASPRREISPILALPDCSELNTRLNGYLTLVRWTDGGALRHARFIDLREDKRPADVVRER